MKRDPELTEKLIAWHRVLLSEANTIVHRIPDDQNITKMFLDDLAASLEHLTERVRREMK